MKTIQYIWPWGEFFENNDTRVKMAWQDTIPFDPKWVIIVNAARLLEIETWLMENIKPYYVVRQLVILSDDNDLMHFKLVWK